MILYVMIVKLVRICQYIVAFCANRVFVRVVIGYVLMMFLAVFTVFHIAFSAMVTVCTARVVCYGVVFTVLSAILAHSIPTARGAMAAKVIIITIAHAVNIIRVYIIL